VSVLVGELVVLGRLEAGGGVFKIIDVEKCHAGQKVGLLVLALVGHQQLADAGRLFIVVPLDVAAHGFDQKPGKLLVLVGGGSVGALGGQGQRLGQVLGILHVFVEFRLQGLFVGAGVGLVTRPDL